MHTHLGSLILLQLLKGGLCFVKSRFRSFCFLSKHITLALRDIDLCLFGIDLRSPWLQFSLLGLNLVVINLRLILKLLVSKKIEARRWSYLSSYHESPPEFLPPAQG